MTASITYKKKGNKYIFHKDAIYFSLTDDQVGEMSHLILEIALMKINITPPLELSSD